MGWDNYISGSTASSSSGVNRREEMDEMRSLVRDHIQKKFSKDKNPVTVFLLEVGILEDMEVLHRLIMAASDNKSVYLYKNKLDAIKSYVTTIKETVVIQEKQAKVDSVSNSEEDFGEISIKFER